MRAKLAFSFLVAAGTLLATTTTSAASSKPSLLIKDATVTAARKGHSSAVSLEVTNETDAAVWITSVTCPWSPMYMLDYDSNMTKSGSHMVAASSIKVKSGHSLTLGLKGEGAMLGSLSKALKVGSEVPLTLGWHSKSKPITTLQGFNARVVKGPKKIYFGGSPNGSMPGMDMS